MCPILWVIEFSSKFLREVLVRELGRVVVIHEVDDIIVATFPPIIPKPLGVVAGYGKDAPVDKDTDFGVVVPLRQRS